LPSGLPDSPQTGCVNAHRCHLKLDALFEHMLWCLLAEVAHNLGSTQDNEMISSVSTNVDSGYSSLGPHSPRTFNEAHLSRCHPMMFQTVENTAIQHSIPRMPRLAATRQG
jgi:hypothetical protein